jgi:hypothetical protein
MQVGFTQEWPRAGDDERSNDRGFVQALVDCHSGQGG